MNDIEKAIGMMKWQKENFDPNDHIRGDFDLAIKALEKQIPNKVNHFLDDDTFETTCCGTDVTNTDYTYCPNCGCLLGEVVEVKE